MSESTAAAAVAAPSSSPPPLSISLRLPSKYASRAGKQIQGGQTQPPPPLSFLHRTWSVTHSTLSMWRTARNVRITYKPLPPWNNKDGSSSIATPRIDDLVEYEAASSKGGVKSVEGVDTCASRGGEGEDTWAWNWRGRGWLCFVTSHWEVLGWGGGTGTEAEADADADAGGRWAVTWFAPTLFTREGIDVYSDRSEGCGAETVGAIMAALKGLGARELVELVERDMREVEISLPWKER